MAKSFKEWLDEGETLYVEAMKDYRELEGQLAELETRLAAKKEEVNQIAAVVGKPPVDTARRTAAADVIDARAPGSVPASRSTIAKVLLGKNVG